MVENSLFCNGKIKIIGLVLKIFKSKLCLEWKRLIRAHQHRLTLIPLGNKIFATLKWKSVWVYLGADFKPVFIFVLARQLI